MVSDDEWANILHHLRQYGLQLIAADRATGTITVRIPPLTGEAP